MSCDNMDTVIHRIAFGANADASAIATGAAVPALVARVHARLGEAFTCYDRHYQGIIGASPAGVCAMASDTLIRGRFDQILLGTACAALISLALGAILAILADNIAYMGVGILGFVLCATAGYHWCNSARYCAYWTALRARPDWVALPRTQTRAQRITGLIDTPERQAFIDAERLCFMASTEWPLQWDHTKCTKARMEHMYDTKQKTCVEFRALSEAEQERVLALMTVDECVYVL